MTACATCHGRGYVCDGWSNGREPILSLCRDRSHPCKCSGDPDCAYIGEDRVHTCSWCVIARGKIKLIVETFRLAGFPLDCLGLGINGLDSPNYRAKATEIMTDLMRPQPPSGALLYGPPGNGKTWTACAILNDLILNTARPGVYTDFQATLSGIRASFDGEGDNAAQSETQTIARLGRVPWLVVNDITEEAYKEFGGRVLLGILDARWTRRRTTGTIVTTNLNPRDLARISGGRVLDRLQGLSSPGAFTRLSSASLRHNNPKPEHVEV